MSFSFSPLTKSHPKWQKDSDVSNCNICSAKLKGGILGSGKHHCRNCGRIVCQTCSKYKYKTHKICQECNEQYELEAYQRLISMGFDDQISWKAAKIYKEDFNKCINYISTQNHHNDTKVNDNCNQARTPSNHLNDNVIMQSPIKQMDAKLAEYYKKLGIDNYYGSATQDDKIGKFELWCNDNEFEDVEQIQDELDQGAENCQLLEFDSKFPLKDDIDNEQLRSQKIFQILKDIFEGKEEYLLELEGKEELSIDDFTLTLQNIENQMATTKKSYQQHLKALRFDFTDINMLYFATISKRNNLLLNIMDSYKRYEVEFMLNNQKSLKPEIILKDWIAQSLFLKELSAKIKTIKVDSSKIYSQLEEETCDNMETLELDLASMIHIYQKRFMPRLIIQKRFMPRVINDDLEIITKYIVASATFIHQLINREPTQFKSADLHMNTFGGAPCCVDFIFLLPHAYEDDSKVNDVIGDVSKRLKDNGVKMYTNYINPYVKEKHQAQVRRRYIEGFNGLAENLKMEDSSYESYPSYRRLNVIVDRRVFVEKKGNLCIMFEPPKHCNTIPREQHIPEAYFDLSRICLVPPGSDSKNTKTINSVTAMDGQIITFSYHVWASNEIKAYLYWNGQCQRFYPQDIEQILPRMFNMNDRNNKEFIASKEVRMLIKDMKIPDIKFERFYRALHGLPKSKFPINYKTQTYE